MKLDYNAYLHIQYKSKKTRNFVEKDVKVNLINAVTSFNI